ncbi:hypothetical protein [Nocardioides coralli]|uniref:hypothetical protein n=1 Tax=Nocardioides coralli TaxID=2872154 RepID=UPI001CA42A22|nr:hypothetical protein [Nocardioides coralli]QZY28352.1 hypothetical protein K6T13_12845 [Nocardioides coralli]
MNPVEEQRVVSALQALTGGLVVTQEDTIKSYEQVTSRLQPPSPRRRIAAAALVAAAAIVAVVVVRDVVADDTAAPPPADSRESTPADALRAALTPDVFSQSDDQFLRGTTPANADLEGLWMSREPHGGFALLMDAEGNYVGPSPSDRLLAGTYSLKGETLTWHMADDGGCARHNSLVHHTSPWLAAIAEDGSLRLRYANVGTSTCSVGDEHEVWDRLGPGATPLGDFLRDSIPALEWRQSTALPPRGLMYSPETGRMVEVLARGRYRHYDSTLALDPAEATDVGRLDGSRDRVDVTCRGGGTSGTLEQAVIPAVADITPPLTAYRFTPEGGGCADGIGAATVWVVLATYI